MLQHIAVLQGAVHKNCEGRAQSYPASRGTNLSARALRELGDGDRLRQLGTIERSEWWPGRPPRQRQTWALSRRVPGLLHGAMGTDPALAPIASVPDMTPPIGHLAIGGDATAEVV